MGEAAGGELPSRLIWVGWWTTLITVSDYFFVSPLLPNFLSKFEVPLESSGWIVGAYSFGAAAAVLPAGSLADRFGRRVVFTGALLVFALGEWVAAFAPGYSLFLLGRWMVGAGSAAASLALTTYLGLHVAYEARGKVMGLIGTAYFLAVPLGPYAGAWMAEHFPLRGLFLLYGFLAFFGVAQAALFLRPDPPVERPAHPWKEYLSIFRVRGFWGIAISQSLFSFGLVGMIQYFGKWLEASLGLGTGERGLVFAIGGIPLLLGSPLGGWMCDRVGKKPFLILATATLAIPVWFLPHLAFTKTGVIVAFSFLGFVAAARYSTYHALSTRLIEEERLGRMLALRNFVNYLASATGVVAMGWIYASSAETGYIRMARVTAVLLACSIPVAIKLIPEEPEK